MQNINRRDFLKGLIGAAAIAVVPAGLLETLSPPKPKIAPIKDSMMYKAIGRKLLMVDELPQGALPRYERDVAVKSVLLPKRGVVPSWTDVNF